MLRVLRQSDFWHGDRRVGRHIAPGELRGYYNDLTAKTLPYSGPTSYLGVPLVPLGKRRGFALHPVTVCQVALGWHERWLDEESEFALRRFLQLANWLVDHQTCDGNVKGIWPVPYAVPLYGLSSGWVSALVQGQAISVLVRAYKITGQEEYLHTAEQALSAFNLDVDRGGIRGYDAHGNLFFEEYPSRPESRVLNGLISALWGLYDYAIATRSCETHSLFLEGTRSLARCLPLYDIGYWSRYSLFPGSIFSDIASPYYHREHIAQLRATSILVPDEAFLSMADKWERCLANRAIVLRVMVAKGVSRIYQRMKHGRALW